MNPDLHIHTLYSHGKHSPAQMYAAAEKKGVAIIGFSEHSPRPEGYDYTHEYRDKLTRHFPDYIAEVGKLEHNPPGSCKVLLGLEMDWLPAEEDFTRRACKAHDYAYLIGSVHFIGHWGFDDGAEAWTDLSQEECEKFYLEYFKAWKGMINSGLFQIAAHPDLIKIFSVDQFHHWLQGGEGQKIVRDCLRALKERGMAMEISSAGLRKVCGEIYPAPQVMAIASELGLRVSLASDAHVAEDIGHAFPQLIKYARSFGFESQSVFDHGRHISLPL